MDFAQVKNQIETGGPLASTEEDNLITISVAQPYPPSFEPIFDAHDLVAALYERIPKENKWKRLAMRKALLNPKVRKAEEAVSLQCRIVLDGTQPEAARQLAGKRIAEAMKYWQQLILGRS